jgi:hypothetical protein
MYLWDELSYENIAGYECGQTDKLITGTVHACHLQAIDMEIALREKVQVTKK